MVNGRYLGAERPPAWTKLAVARVEDRVNPDAQLGVAPRTRHISRHEVSSHRHRERLSL